MKHLGIDFGERRIGLAMSDDEGKTSVPLLAIPRSNDREAVARILAIAEENEIEVLVLGEPRGLDGSVGEAAERARSFGAKLAKASHRPLHLIDEALTSVEAEARLREAGVPPRKRRDKRDALAAQILLQDWLDGSGR